MYQTTIKHIYLIYISSEPDNTGIINKAINNGVLKIIDYNIIKKNIVQSENCPLKKNIISIKSIFLQYYKSNNCHICTITNSNNNIIV